MPNLDESGSYARHGLFSAIVNQIAKERAGVNRACLFFQPPLERWRYPLLLKNLLNEQCSFAVADPSRKEPQNSSMAAFSRRC